MQVTPALKNEIAQWLDTYWTTYFKGDIETWATFIRDDYRNIGGTKEEIWNSKQEIIDYTRRILDQMIGTAEIRNREIDVIPYGEYMMVNEFTDLYIKVEGEWTLYGPFRMSSLLEKTNTGWIALHQHGSYPDMKALEGEAYSMDALKAENVKLQEAVKNRTIELEIEAALERVRGKALAMHDSHDISETSSAAFEELKKLGIHSIRSGVGLLTEDSHDAQVYAATQAADGRIKALTTRRSMLDHPALILQYDEWKMQVDFEQVLSGDDLISYYNHQFYQSAKDGIHKANAGITEYGYYFSFKDGLFYSWSDQPYTDAEKNILQRFRSIIALTFRRYLDLKNAEAQAKEAKIEAALEKVRSRTMAMQSSAELGAVAAELFAQMNQLVTNLWTCGFVLCEKDRNEDEWWLSMDGDFTRGFFLPNVVDYAHATLYEGWLKGEALRAVQLDGESLQQHYDWLMEIPVSRAIFEEMDAAGLARPDWQKLHAAYFSKGYLVLITREPCGEEEIFKRFAQVFDQTYTRFLDLQKAEAQARESQIQLALERVRARTMAMQRSDELQDAAILLFQQVQALGVQTGSCGFNIWNKDDKTATVWMSSAEGGFQTPFVLPHTESAIYNQVYEAKKNDEKFLVKEVEGENLKKHFDYLLTLPGIGEVIKILRETGYAFPETMVYHFAFFSQGYLSFHLHEHHPETHDIFQRFAKVFEQTYTRFLDLQKAEAQAREAQIEAALERVRSRSMAMHKSDELLEAGEILFLEMQKLGIESLTAGYVLIDKEEKNGLNYTPHPGTKKIMPVPVIIPHNETIHMQEVVENWKKGKPFFIVEMDEEETIKHQTFIAERSTNFPLSAAQLIAISPAKLVLHNFYFKEGYILIVGGTKLSAQQTDIMLRFVKVFQQTYTRFLDLQKAEAQAKEAHIQLALERVRARTMAMHKSDELAETVSILFKQLLESGIELSKLRTCGIATFHEREPIGDVFMSDINGDIISDSFEFRFDEAPSYKVVYEAWKKGENFLVLHLTGQALVKHFTYVRKYSGVTNFNLEQIGNEFKEIYFHVMFFSQGYLFVISYESLSEHHDTLKRFGALFQQTYTRFLDFKKTEAQTKEAQIEAALERVRSRSLAMHHSSELSAMVDTLLREFTNLEFTLTFCIINLIDEHDKSNTVWAANPETGKLPESYYMKFEDYPFHHAMWNAWKNQEKRFIYTIEGHEKKIYDEYLYTNTEFRRFPKHVQEANKALKRYVAGFTFFKYSGLQTVSENNISDDELYILERFGKVFEQSYTRFLDLQKAEAQAREAQIETALEKVRSRTLAMQKSDELAETASVLFQQLIALGIEPNRLYITLIHAGRKEADFWITNEDGSKLTDAYTANLEDNDTFKKMYNGWEKKLQHLVIDMQGEELQNYFQYLQSRNVPFKGGLEQKRRVQHLAYFTKGFIGMASPDEQPVETLQLLERFAAAFNLTFTRFNDLKIAEANALQAGLDLMAIKEAKQKAEDALTELQATQKQLVQAEKMASLGELTAGIAHEIQNPLNFVNNFSEVSNELISEMVEEVDKGNTEEVKAIAKDIKQNLEKINHHGKRADAIVKGMLQHSSSGSGKKEPTNINALADEYLRLAYHGLRAKDKSFNATMKTDFDETIGNINIIPQDIGRVILNLISNAFYVLDEKKKSGIEGYEPAIAVSTKKINDKVEIKVTDNGNGIPQKILDKIFQPFFTTKPTGQGTGLGLSLSYDIVKAHGGELRVETREGKGTEFLIQIPVVAVEHGLEKKIN